MQVVANWTKHLSPKETNDRFLDMPNTMVAEGNSLSFGLLPKLIQCDLMWLGATDSFKITVDDPASSI